MAVTAALNFKGLAASAAYIRLVRVFGGKDEGQWTGIFNMYGSEAKAYPNGRTVEDVPQRPSADVVAEFSVAVGYQDTDPRALVFAALKDKLPELYDGSNVADA